MYKIYVLIDPTTKTIRYVGRTNQGHIKRLNRHIRDSKKQTNHKANWIKSIINNGNLPLILIVENNLPSIEEANLAEIHYIKSFKSLGGTITTTVMGRCSTSPTLMPAWRAGGAGGAGGGGAL